MQKKEGCPPGQPSLQNNKLIRVLIFFNQFPSTSVKTAAVWSLTVILICILFSEYFFKLY